MRYGWFPISINKLACFHWFLDPSGLVTQDLGGDRLFTDSLQAYLHKQLSLNWLEQ
jgi:hypothetical protein